MTKRYLVSRTYSETTPESAQIGDFSDTGFEFQDSPMNLCELLRELQNCTALSACPARTAQDCAHTWAETDWFTTDYRTGTDRQECVHIKNLDGSTVNPRRLFRIYKLAGLIPS